MFLENYRYGSAILVENLGVCEVLDGTVLQRKSKSAGQLLVATTANRKKKPGEKRTLALIDENTRSD